MTDPTQNWKKIRINVPVHVPTMDGRGIQESILVEVDALQNPADGEVYFTGEALEKLDAMKARHMGLMSPECVRELRERLELTQKQMSELLQIGEKTWTRWEAGRDRSSRSLNLLLHAVYDGKVDIGYLQLMSRPALREKPLRATPRGGVRPVPFTFDLGTATATTPEKIMKASPLNLLDYYVTELSMAVNKAYDYQKPSEFRLEDIVVEPNTIQLEQAGAEAKNSGKWQMTLRVRHMPAPDRNASCQFLVELIGMFEVTPGYPPENAQTLVEVNGASMLYGAARQVVRSATAQGSHPPVSLPSLSFYPPKEPPVETK